VHSVKLGIDKNAYPREKEHNAALIQVNNAVLAQVFNANLENVFKIQALQMSLGTQSLTLSLPRSCCALPDGRVNTQYIRLFSN
jgi:hypothetical protein